MCYCGAKVFAVAALRGFVSVNEEGWFLWKQSYGKHHLLVLERGSSGNGYVRVWEHKHGESFQLLIINSVHKHLRCDVLRSHIANN